MDEFGAAAKTAATDPQTWVPLLGAAVLQIDDADERWSRDLAEDQPLFGDDAEDVSHNLRDTATGAYVLTALLAPSDKFGDKARGLGVGAGTMILDGVFSQGIKDLSGRERPYGSNDQSMPSGHASKAASRTNMAIRNLQYMDLDPWQRSVLTWGLHGVAVGTGLARVEANKHHISDIMVGYAVGHFVSTFMFEAFMKGSDSQAQLSFVPIEDGGAIKFSIPLK